MTEKSSNFYEDNSCNLQDLLKNEVKPELDILAESAITTEVISDHKLDKLAAITIFSSDKSLGKKIFGNEQGEIIKQSGSQWVDLGGTFTVDNIVALAECHKECSEFNEYALGYGIAKDSGLPKLYRIGLKNKTQEGEITRTNADFEWPEIMVLMFDLDSYEGMTPDEQLAKFFEINPELVITPAVKYRKKFNKLLS